MPQPRFRFDRPEKELSEVETLTVDELLSTFNEIQTQKISDERREIPSELWKGLAGERAGILRRRSTAASCAAPLEKAKRLFRGVSYEGSSSDRATLLILP